MIRKLRLKFIGVNMLIVLVLLSLLLGLILQTTRTRMEADSLRMMRGIAAAPMRPLRPDGRNEEVNLPFFKLTLSPEGELLTCEGGYFDLSDEAVLDRLIAAVRSSGEETGFLEEYRLRYLVRETAEEEILVFSDITSELHAYSHLRTVCLLIGLAGLALFLAVSMLLARWAVRPVERAWEQQKQFVGDASHELKTPLTVILTDTELLQSEACSETDRAHFLSSIRVMSEQMRGLVEELLSLTRADNPDTARIRQTMDLSSCVSAALLPFEPVFYEKGLSLSAEIEDGIQVKGNETQLRQVTEILLDNAQKYCSPGTETLLRLRRQGNTAILSVDSHGTELSRQERKDIFRRFYRLDRVRSMNHSYGLGLAIAKQITESHGGKIWAESNGGINRFCVQLRAVPIPRPAAGGRSPSRRLPRCCSRR